ncbi:glycoside hydrolase family protein [Oculatella sp. FACHB-28]|uniref:glycoside hydrolase family 24 protein n=1 Tax=Oculatella sp. FACHB-28 TaxID=2692845 RepID=UPI00321F705B
MRPSPSQASEKLSAAEREQNSGSFWHFLIILSIVGMSLTLMSKDWQGSLTGLPLDSNWDGHPIPLAMRGGDPYIRALMRTISVSESSDPQPYSIVYGGDRIQDLSSHPDRCIPIVAGPNLGDCTTAAGRYQFLTTTWLEKAREYHSKPPAFLFRKTYSFAPEFQDEVVYDWLTDSQAWGVDLSALLRSGNIEEVLQILSGTWTSLGYGIETNAMTASLPEVYYELLKEELQAAGQF